MHDPRSTQHAARACALALSIVGCSSGSSRENVGALAQNVEQSQETGAGMYDNGAGPVSSFLPSTKVTDVAWAKPTTSTSPAPTGLTKPRDAVLSDAAQTAQTSPSALVRFSIRLPDTVSAEQVAALSDAEKVTLATSRAASLAPIQASVAVKLAQYGASVVSWQLLAHGAVVEAPATAVPSILAEDFALDASPVAGSVMPGGMFDGQDIRNGTLTFQLLNYGYDGEFGGRTSYPSDNVKIAILDTDNPNTHHAGWKDWVGGPSRIIKYYVCGDAGCVPQTNWPTQTAGHGTTVMSIAAGSIEEGTDPAFPGSGTLAQKQRSGIAKEADIYYFRLDSPCGVTNAVGTAILDGVDVLNLSIGVYCTAGWQCNHYYDCCNLNAQLQNAVAWGVVVNACGGNEPASSSCLLWYPATRSETVSVIALDALNNGVPYEDLVVNPATQAHGPMSMRTWTGAYVTTPGVDIVAPGSHRYTYTGAAGYQDTGSGSACSYATPVITGATAIMRHAFWWNGWSLSSGAMMANLLMQGDASNGTANGESSTVSSVAGYGRLRMYRPPPDPGLAPPWGWGWRTVTLNSGVEFRWPVGDAGPESYAITEWKWALLWLEPDLHNVAEIAISVWDVCPPGRGTPPQLIAYDFSTGLRKRIHLYGSQIGGKCLEMRATGLSVPPNGRTVYSADSYHSGNTEYF